MLWAVFSLCKYTGNSFSLVGLAVACNATVIAGMLVPACKTRLRNLLWGLLVPVEFPSTTAMLMAGVVYTWFSCLWAMRNTARLNIWVWRIKLLCGDLAKSSVERPFWLCCGSVLLARGWWCVNLIWRMGPDLQMWGLSLNPVDFVSRFTCVTAFLTLSLAVTPAPCLSLLSIWSSQCEGSMTSQLPCSLQVLE